MSESGGESPPPGYGGVTPSHPGYGGVAPCQPGYGGLAPEYHLCWNNYQSSLSSFLRGISPSQEGDDILTDITISCSGQKNFQAHRLVLVTCSSYFRHLLFLDRKQRATGDVTTATAATCPGHHPIVYIPDLDDQVMELLLSYMYQGEVTVPSHLILPLMEAARLLGVHGLTDPPLPATPSSPASSPPEDLSQPRKRFCPSPPPSSSSSCSASSVNSSQSPPQVLCAPRLPPMLPPTTKAAYQAGPVFSEEINGGHDDDDDDDLTAAADEDENSLLDGGGSRRNSSSGHFAVAADSSDCGNSSSTATAKPTGHLGAAPSSSPDSSGGFSQADSSESSDMMSSSSSNTATSQAAAVSAAVVAAAAASLFGAARRNSTGAAHASTSLPPTLTPLPFSLPAISLGLSLEHQLRSLESSSCGSQLGSSSCGSQLGGVSGRSAASFSLDNNSSGGGRSIGISRRRKSSPTRNSLFSPTTSSSFSPTATTNSGLSRTTSTPSTTTTTTTPSTFLLPATEDLSRPFACTICPKRFRMKHHLKEHNLIHSGEMPFSCHLCPKRFNRSYTLKNHMKLHSNTATTTTTTGQPTNNSLKDEFLMPNLIVPLLNPSNFR